METAALPTDWKLISLLDTCKYSRETHPLTSMHTKHTDISADYKYWQKPNKLSNLLAFFCFCKWACFKRLLILHDIKVVKQSHDHVAIPEKIASRMTYCSDLQVPIVKESTW